MMSNTPEKTIDTFFELQYAAFTHLINVQKFPVQAALKEVPSKYRDAVFNRWKTEIELPNPHDTVVKVVDRRPVWTPGYSSANGSHWNALRNFLLTHKGRDALQVQKLDAASDEVLFSLADPTNPTKSKNPEQYIGLVMGFVQSGKTANYTALTAKAYDAGYKLVIVLTGIHNALRRQTQIRLNDELGVVASSESRPTASTLGPNDPEGIKSLTIEDLLAGDFKNLHLPNSILATGKYLCVTKKNASVLRGLIKWLGNNVGVPVLIIDDEADQASINTGGNDGKEKADEDPDADVPDKDRDPAVINGLIRNLAWNCKGVLGFVGYTATPYANVFIDKQAIDTNHERDLYPRDFIIALPKPEGYMGPEEFFGPQLDGEEADKAQYSDNVIQIVPESDSVILEKLPHSTLESNLEKVLPASLVRAFREWILATAARRTVEKSLSPSAFLAHTTHKQEKQSDLARYLEKYLVQLNQDWRYDRDSVIARWQSDWELFCQSMSTDKFAVKFEELTEELDKLLGKFGEISVRLLNFKSEDDLDYELEPNLTTVVVGGNKLSRGLTIEGLLVSYFVRQTKQPKADTLTQMGRFFGYREHIVDVTRVYTTDQLRNDFREISQQEASLRREVALYARLGKTPADFAPRVRRRMHLMPTAKNKMKSAESLGISYSGDLIQTTSFPSSDDLIKGKSKHEHNLEATSAFLGELTTKFQAECDNLLGGGTARFLWRNVDSKLVTEYLAKFAVASGSTRFVPSKVLRYISDLQQPKGELSPELTNWNVALVGRKPLAELGEESFGTKTSVGRILRSLDNGSLTSIGTLITPLGIDDPRGDEIIDLAMDDIVAARKLRLENPAMKAADAVRSIRSPETGLLIIYPISPASKASGGKSEITLGDAIFGKGEPQITIVGLCIVFPNSKIEIEEYFVQKSEIANGE